ncbi:MAG: hypothetical protein KKA65_03225 [Nanoarchaeota archaeon]|nr:hypothetical protein [Nanoarchaeota archaeon]MBU4351500.1 hypothetical protein [Nanoarchaeota archaeon]MBU4456489.1 hypothetical protein [Nanoarchaeota archaeon]
MELLKLRDKMKENLIVLNQELEKVEQGVRHQAQKVVLEVLTKYERTNGLDSLGVPLTFLKSELYRNSEEFTEKDIFEAIEELVDKKEIKHKYSFEFEDSYFTIL